jgi:uncharacterized protein (DUF697 family)
MSWFDSLIQSIRANVFGEDPGDGIGSSGAAGDIRSKRQTEAPVIWLLGKTGAGKSAIVATLTGDSRAAVGEGFEPCTKTARLYDFPSDAPQVRFLDTRGLEEAGYDPAEDLAWCEGQAHVVLSVMRVGDPSQDRVLDILRAARSKHPNWPVVVAQTALHECYPDGMKHPESDYFAGTDADDVWTALPHEVRSALAYQRGLFKRFPGDAPTFVPLDFTRPDDGYAPRDFGVDRLLTALSAAGLVAIANLLRQAGKEEGDALRRSCRQLIYAYAGAALGGAAIPLPYVDFATIAATNGMMLRALAGRYGVEWTAANLTQFFGAIGVGALAWWGVRYGVRELLKIVPFIGWAAGAALNGAAAFSLTAAIGEADCVWLGYLSRGEDAPGEEIQRAFREGFMRKPPAQDGAAGAVA